MTRTSATIWLALAAATLVAAGCNETAKTPLQAHAPAQAPAPQPVAVAQTLPFPAHAGEAAYLTLLRPESRPAMEVLLEQVQASFTAGQEAYKAGNLDLARDSFDRAEELILASGFTTDADPRLAALFNQITDTTQSYEAEAQKGNEEEVPGTPAPIDELTDLTLPPGDPRLAARAEKELMRVPHDLPLTVNDSVLQYLSFFTTTRGRAIVERGLGRAGRYDELIRRVLREEGLPTDLMYLAQAESAFLPQAVSRAGARGIWQFMPFRGEEYDLARTYYIDERSDPEKSTRAAAHHLRDLYDMFGDWYLVMAAYNSGPGNVIRAIERTGYADFWEMQKRNALPKQTRNYVPIILALALVGKDPAGYGVEVQPEKPPVVDIVHPQHPLDLHLAADATGADIDELHALNPQLTRNVTPADAKFELKLPAGTAQKFAEGVERVPQDKWTSWRLHTVESGETLAEIAKHYRVTVPAIISANQLQPRAVVPAGFVLEIPTAPPATRLVHYRVVRGDTLQGIAERFDVTVSELKRWNNIHGSTAPRGARLRIYAGGEPAAPPRARPKAAGQPGAATTAPSASAAKPASEPVQHRVKPGETLYQIAHAYRTTVEALRQANPFLADRPLLAGDLLIIER